MTDDLVKRLRDLSYNKGHDLPDKAADRIKKLEGTLLKIKDLHHQLGPEDEQVIEIRDDMT